MMFEKLGLAIVGLAVLADSSQVSAHHAFSAEFDAKAPVTLKGPVTKVEWINPHAWIHMEVTGRDGKKAIWMVEGGTPNTLQRAGISRDSIKIGTVIVVEGFRAKDGRARANGRDITLPDGRTLLMGSSGAAAAKAGPNAAPTPNGLKR